MRILKTVLILVWALSACTSADERKAKVIAELSDQEQKMRSLESLDTSLAVDLINSYQSFLEAYPKDSLSPIYLRKMAEVYRAWPGKEVQTVDTYNLLAETFTYHEEGKKALLSTALFFEEKGNKDEASRYYQRFIDQFPSHPLADQARQLKELLENETVSDIQLVEEWMRKAKDSSQKESNSVN